ncbi:MAG: hypothetical protein IH846_10250 [Acidobacteria bacterium]|nr:hypothetical protein [Acidobacteriota bacterium]
MGTQTFGQERLISWEPLPQLDGAMCQWVPASASMSLRAALQQSGAPTREQTAERDPLRVIRDPYPSFSSVAVDMERGEVVVGDENMFQILVYDRLANTPPGATMTEPRRIIAGDQTGLEFVCGLYLDQPTGDVYVINADTAAQMQVFTRSQEGNVPPLRVLNTGHETRGRGIAVDSENKEIFIASQHNAALVVFRQYAEENEPQSACCRATGRDWPTPMVLPSTARRAWSTSPTMDRFPVGRIGRRWKTRMTCDPTCLWQEEWRWLDRAGFCRRPSMCIAAPPAATHRRCR